MPDKKALEKQQRLKWEARRRRSAQIFFITISVIVVLSLVLSMAITR